MTDNVALRGMMISMFGDLRAERRSTGSRGAMPPPQPGISMPEPQMAQGNRVDWAELVTAPQIDQLTTVPSDPTQVKSVQIPKLLRGWGETEQGATTITVAAERGGTTPNFRTRSGSQESLIPNYLNAIEATEGDT